MGFLSREDRLKRRRDPSVILPRVQAVIMAGMMYWPGTTGFPKGHDVRGDEGETRRGIVSSYAWGKDYHEILGSRLKQLAEHLNKVAGGIGRFYVDTGAFLERDFAERAGLGFIGKNSLVINPRMGSGFFIGEILTTVELPFDADEDKGTKPRERGEPGCGKCKKCRVACPTGAIVEDHVVDARKCISYLTIELKGSIPVELRKKMGRRIYGCDICQQVCPWNRIAWEQKSEKGGGWSPLFGTVSEEVTSPGLQELLELDKDGFDKRFNGSAIQRIGRERMARNAAVGLGNCGGIEMVEVLERVVRDDESELVREHARWAADEIRKRCEI